MSLRIRNNLTWNRPSPIELPADSPELTALAGHVKAGRCALFVGAGLSAPAGLPTWSGLLERLVVEATPWAVDAALFPASIPMSDPAARARQERRIEVIRGALGRQSFDTLCRRIQRVMRRGFDLQVLHKALSVVYEDSIDRAEQRKLAQSKRFAELAGHCRDRIGQARFQDLVRRLLSPRGEPPASHRDIVRTPYACVVTTNFDTLIEDAYARYEGLGVPRAPTGAELGQQGELLLHRGFFVLKAHGDATRPETMIFTADDYRRVIHANPAFQAILSGILLTHAVLFVGYSLSDPNFRLLLDNHLTIFNGNVPPRYAVLSGVGRAEAEILWKTAKLQVLAYPDGQHAEVGRCLEALANHVDGNSSATARRRSKGRRALSPPGIAEPYCTLHLQGDGGRLLLEWVRHPSSSDAVRVWTGGAPSPDIRRHGDEFQAADDSQVQGADALPHVERVGALLGRALPPPLRRRLRQLPPGHPVEIACTPGLMRIPWEWVLLDGRPLALSHPITRRPGEITHQARGRRWVGRPLRALVFGDAGSGNALGEIPLRFADLEAKAIEHLLRKSSPGAEVVRLSREAATYRRVLKELEGGDYDIIHFGGHAWFDDREAYFCLWDRIMLGSELAPLLSRRPPALLVLDTHYTAFVMAEVDALLRELVGSPDGRNTTPDSSEPRGFAEAAMRCGVTSFVGAFGNVGDRSGAEVAVAFFAELMMGTTVAEALRAARVRTGDSTGHAGLFYTAFGYPDFRLVNPAEKPCSAAAVTEAIGEAKARAGWERDSLATR